jgi:Neuraminidase (sialidase)
MISVLRRLSASIPVIVLLLVRATPSGGADAQWVNLQLNRDATTQVQNEEQIAINPTNPDNMVAVWRDFRTGVRRVGWAYTFDGGETWTEGGLITEPKYPFQSDPGVTADRDGNFYAVVLSYAGGTIQTDGLFVLKSTDGGVTWGAPLQVVDAVPDVFEDKEFIACDRTSGRHRGNLYVTWTRFSRTSDIMARRSTDSGLTWSNTIAVSDESSVQFPIPVVGRNGEVFIAWTSYTTSAIMLDVSMDGGASFGQDRQVISVDEVSPVLEGGINAYASPHMDADISYGIYSGRLYIAFMDRRSGMRDFDIWVISSNDKGLTWTEPVRINDDQPNNGLDQFHPWLTVDNLGVVTVVWLDRRHDSKNLKYHCYISQSTDGGVTWSSNVQVSTEPSDPTYAFPTYAGLADPDSKDEEDADTKHPYRSAPMAGLIGEYIGVVSWNGTPTPIWTDIRNLNQDAFAGYLKQPPAWPTPADLARGLIVVPNPVRPGQGVTVWSGLDGPGVLSIHDAMGRRIRTIDNVQLTDGKLMLPSRELGGSTGGIYFLRLRTPSRVSNGKLILVE